MPPCRAVTLVMNGNHAWHVNRAIATAPRPKTQIYILVIQEKARIKSAKLLPHVAPDQHCCADHVIDIGCSCILVSVPLECAPMSRQPVGVERPPRAADCSPILEIQLPACCADSLV